MSGESHVWRPGKPGAGRPVIIDVSYGARANMQTLAQENPGTILITHSDSDHAGRPNAYGMPGLLTSRPAPRPQLEVWLPADWGVLIQAWSVFESTANTSQPDDDSRPVKPSLSPTDSPQSDDWLPDGLPHGRPTSALKGALKAAACSYLELEHRERDEGDAEVDTPRPEILNFIWDWSLAHFWGHPPLSRFWSGHRHVLALRHELIELERSQSPGLEWLPVELYAHARNIQRIYKAVERHKLPIRHFSVESPFRPSSSDEALNKSPHPSFAVLNAGQVNIGKPPVEVTAERLGALMALTKINQRALAGISRCTCQCQPAEAIIYSDGDTAYKIVNPANVRLMTAPHHGSMSNPNTWTKRTNQQVVLSYSEKPTMGNDFFQVPGTDRACSRCPHDPQKRRPHIDADLTRTPPLSRTITCSGSRGPDCMSDSPPLPRRKR